MKEELEQQKAENERLKKFTETYLSTRDKDTKNNMNYNFDIKANSTATNSSSSSRRKIVNDDMITIDDHKLNENAIGSSNGGTMRSNSTNSNDRKKESIHDKKIDNEHNTNKSSIDVGFASTCSTSSNDEQLSVKSNHLALSLGLAADSAISIPKPWMKKSTKSISATTTSTNKANEQADVHVLMKGSTNVLLSNSLHFPESEFSSGQSDDIKVTSIEGPNSKYLHPLKNRLEELLRSVKAETTSYSEIRTNIKKRVGREHQRL